MVENRDLFILRDVADEAVNYRPFDDVKPFRYIPLVRTFVDGNK